MFFVEYMALAIDLIVAVLIKFSSGLPSTSSNNLFIVVASTTPLLVLNS